MGTRLYPKWGSQCDLGWQQPTSGMQSCKLGVFNRSCGPLEGTFWKLISVVLVDTPLAFGHGEEASCPAVSVRVPYNEELSHVPCAFECSPRLHSLTFTNVNQQHLEHRNHENKF